MKTKLFDYVERDNLIFNLSGLSKFLCFVCMTFAVMLTYDIRYILFITVLSIIFFWMSELKFKQIKLMIIYVAIFLTFNFVLTYLFSPTYGVEIYGTCHEILHITDRYIVTEEQLLYQITKISKYASMVPLGMLFLLSTNPSEFAASLNRAKVNYKVCYVLSLTLRYFPDVIRDYKDISLAQQSRGLDFSQKEKTSTRVKNSFNIMVPLILSTLDRVDLISNAMDLRSFGKHKKRTWYVAEKLKTSDYVTILMGVLLLLGSFFMTAVVNGGSRFWNPFI